MKKGLIVALLCLGLTNSVMARPSAEKSRFEKLELFNKILYLIESQYYREVDTEKLIEGAIKGMMGTLDPHSAFLDKEVFAKMQEDTSGEFGGLGIEVSQKDGIIVVITPIDDTPAYRAGIKAGDKIVEIDHEPTIGMTLEEAVDHMRGKANSKIAVGIVRAGVEGIKTYDLKREVIKVKAVKSELLQDEFIWVRLTQFQKDAGKEIAEAIKKERKGAKKKIRGIVLDLRSNPGGLLEEAVDVCSIFLKDGVVVSTEGRDPKNKEIKYVRKSGYKEVDVPMAVLINGASASASEIVAGCLQDQKRAVIVGTQSFGKGSVQTVAKVDDTQGVKLTIAQYMTPNSRKIQAVGITPDVWVDEYEGEWVAQGKNESRYIRESDLRNHLTATIETPDEKKVREQREHEERLERARRREEARRARKSKDKTDDEPRAYDVKQDYQVSQAINYLRSFEVFRKMEKQPRAMACPCVAAVIWLL